MGDLLTDLVRVRKIQVAAKCALDLALSTWDLCSKICDLFGQLFI